jgi:hypothetical protein
LRRALLTAFLIAVVAAGSATGSTASPRGLPDTTLPLGATYTITGQTARAPGSGRATGRVVLTGRLNGGPWRFIAQTFTNRDGMYRLKVKPTRRGRLELRLRTPDHGETHVVLTVT